MPSAALSRRKRFLKGKKGGKGRECFNCGELGHLRESCPFPPDKGKGFGKSKGPTDYGAWDKGRDKGKGKGKDDVTFAQLEAEGIW